MKILKRRRGAAAAAANTSTGHVHRANASLTGLTGTAGRATIRLLFPPSRRTTRRAPARPPGPAKSICSPRPKVRHVPPPAPVPPG